MAFEFDEGFINVMESESIFQQSINDYPDDQGRIAQGYSRTQEAIVYDDFENLENFHEHRQYCDGCWQDLPVRFVDEYVQNRKARSQNISLGLMSEKAKQELQRKSAKVTNVRDPYTAELFPNGDEFYTGQNEFEAKGDSYVLHPVYKPQVWKKVKNEYSNLSPSTDGNLKAYFSIDSQTELSYFKDHYGLIAEKEKLKAENNNYQQKLQEEHADWDSKTVAEEANGALSNYEDSDSESYQAMDAEYRNLVAKRREDVIKNTVTWKAIAAKEAKKKNK